MTSENAWIVIPNKGMNRSAKERRSLVPVALRAPAPGYAQRWALRYARCYIRFGIE